MPLIIMDPDVPDHEAFVDAVTDPERIIAVCSCGEDWTRPKDLTFRSMMWFVGTIKSHMEELKRDGPA